MKRSALKRRTRNTGPDASTELAVIKRDEARCVICGQGISGERGKDWSLHHRLPRGAGGSREVFINLPANLIVICGSGTTGCHGWAESRRTEAQDAGYLIRHGDDPADMPIHHAVHGLSWLDDLGRVTTISDREDVDPTIVQLIEPYEAIDRLGRHRRWPSVAARLWRTVIAPGADDCWEWQGYRNPSGYGQIGVRGAKLALAHRVAYQISTGRAIPESMQVMHSCDNPPCCNPDHLSVGTASQNAQDMVAKGRGYFPVNEENGRTRLTVTEVQEIRRRRATGEYCKVIAADFGIHPTHVSRIARNLRRQAADHPPVTGEDGTDG